QAQTAAPPVCRPLFSAKFRLCPRLLPTASDTRATIRPLLQKASSLRPAKVADSPVYAQLLQDAQATARSLAFSAVQVFSELECSRGLFHAALIFGSARKRKVDLSTASMKLQLSSDSSSGSILRHDEEPKQFLCVLP